MIISHKYELVFVTTPKAGSLTGFTLMRDYFEAVGKFNHRRNIPSGVTKYHSFTFVRNPYERFCSVFNARVAMKQPQFIKQVPEKAKSSMEAFASWMINFTPPADSISGVYTSQSYWHKKSSVKEFIHIEDAAKVFTERYPELNIKFPHARQRKHKAWDDVKTDELTLLINKWAGEDFERFGYKKEFNIPS